MIRKSVAEILDDHVTFELEGIDRMGPRAVDHDGGADE
jgi:hypothetical protein